MNKEAIELLEEAKIRFGDSINRLIDQALAKLTEQPPVGKFTERIRTEPSSPKWKHTVIIRTEDRDELCNRLDALEARLKAMYAGDLSPESRLNGYKVIVAELKKEISGEKKRKL